MGVGCGNKIDVKQIRSKFFTIYIFTIDINYLVNHLNKKEKIQKNNNREKKNNKQKSFLAMRRPRENARLGGRETNILILPPSLTSHVILGLQFSLLDPIF